MSVRYLLVAGWLGIGLPVLTAFSAVSASSTSNASSTASASSAASAASEYSVVVQSFHNLDFSQTCDSSKTGLCYWDLSWGNNETCRPEVIGDNRCLAIHGATERSVGFAEQSVLIPDDQQMMRIDIAARISTDDVVGKGAGLNVGVYDSQENLLFTKDMGYAAFGWRHGSTEWTECRISALCPAGARKIKLGAILYGKGTARFDDYRVDLTPVSGRSANALALARAYVSAACDSIALHSLVRDSVAMDSLKEIALEIAGQAANEAECHLAVEFLVASLRTVGDEHSFFMTPSAVSSWASDSSATADVQFPTGRIVDSCGYVLVPPFHSGNEKLAQAYCDSLHAVLRRLDAFAVLGWIIDLRSNTGGNMEPMLAGLGPLFDSDRLGSLVDVDGRPESWYYRDGTYYWTDQALMQASSPTELSSRKRVAVLTSSQTGSSGEAVAISFIGNGKTRFFGEPTWGLTTGNGSFDLPDGARIMLASTIMADRNGKMYHGPIEPDELVEQRSNQDEDMVLQRAIQWVTGDN